jgi:hypothetical protein
MNREGYHKTAGLPTHNRYLRAELARENHLVQLDAVRERARLVRDAPNLVARAIALGLIRRLDTRPPA